MLRPVPLSSQKRRQEKQMMRHDPDVQDLTARYDTRVLDPVRAPGRHAIAAWALAVAVALAAFLGPPLTRQAVAALLELRHGVLMLDREFERVSVRSAATAEKLSDPCRTPSSQEMAKAWRPYVETCIEAFGAHRCMFESNFPVDKGACSYPVLFNAFKRLASGASAGEKTDLFAGTAARFYRLGI